MYNGIIKGDLRIYGWLRIQTTKKFTRPAGTPRAGKISESCKNSEQILVAKGTNGVGGKHTNGKEKKKTIASNQKIKTQTKTSH